MRLHPTTTHRRHLLVATALVLGVLTTGCKPWGPVTSQYNGHTVVSGEGCIVALVVVGVHADGCATCTTTAVSAFISA